MGLASEFKQFAVKGNVVDLAVGVVIGAAFGKIVSALVENVIMPPLGLALSGVNFSDLALTLATDPSGKPVLLKYGAFLQSVLDFVIIAFVLFVAIKGINRLKEPSPVEGPPAAPAPEPVRQEVLLEEIRDLLARKP
jgi:large conductance mechanosensitive channel